MTTHLERRRIEAELVKPIHAALVAEIGAEKARNLLAGVVRQLAIEAGQAVAEGEAKEGKGPTDLLSFSAMTEVWSAGGALEIQVLEKSAQRFSFDVSRCLYAEMYRELGMSDLGDVLSCNRDGVFCTGYDPRIRMTRTETIMGGAKRCAFRYTLDDNP